MTKLQKNIINNKKASKKVPPLDNSSQLSNNFLTPIENSSLANLKKRAKAKYISDAITTKLANIQKTKKEAQPFWNTYHCSKILVQEGKKLTSKYCNNRWCIVCNRIRSAKLIAGYSKQLSEFKDAQFVTLTVKNVKSNDLKNEIDFMFAAFNTIRKGLHYKGKGMVGIRKLEVTYNDRKDDYHPHFHLIVEGKQSAEDIVKRWLYTVNKGYSEDFIDRVDKEVKEKIKLGYDAKKYIVLSKNIEVNRKPLKSDPQWQDVRPGDTKSIIELFKYFTKMFTKKGVNIKALNVMIKALKGRRVVQPISIKKAVSEEVDDIEAIVYTELEDNLDFWEFIENDWYSRKHGNELTGFRPSEVLIELSKKIF